SRLDAWLDLDGARSQWRVVIDHLNAINEAEKWRCDVWRRGFAHLSTFERHVPSPDDLNAWLEPTGWRVSIADGFVAVDDYQRCHAEKVFPICRYVRRARDIDHSPTPDYLHDVLGHLPMLFDPRYSQLLQAWGKLGESIRPSGADVEMAASLSHLLDVLDQDHIDPMDAEAGRQRLAEARRRSNLEPSRFSRHEKFYTWAIEFGIFGAERDLNLIGAAALSSAGELQRLISRQVQLGSFKHQALQTSVDYTTYQPQMFVSAGFDEYFEVLDSI
ncbi:MAG: hypothetical protein KGZ91_12070, partial [Afipia sp.]|nr:hypothetical protein [Afipia sp.]